MRARFSGRLHTRNYIWLREKWVFPGLYATILVAEKTGWLKQKKENCNKWRM
jgi:hypothetical protein